MKKILLLSAAACMFSFVHAEDGDSAGGHGFYVGGGFLLCNSGERVEYKANGDPSYDESNDFKTQFGGTLLVGYQGVLSSAPVCLGVELGSDFMPRQEHKHADKLSSRVVGGQQRIYDLTTSRNGFVPFAAFRVGYISHEYKTMVYLKAGVSYVKSKEIYDEFDGTGVYPLPEFSGTVKLSSWMPTIALGAEKSIAKDITGRLEGEYRFAKSKTKTSSTGDATKLTQKGTFNIRALVCYNVKI